MKPSFLVYLFVFFAVLALNAQDFQGKATYQSKTSSDRTFEGRQLSEEQKRRMAQRMKSVFEKSFELVFDRTVSLYSEEEKLDAPSGNQGGRGGFRAAFDTSTEGIYYKNILQKKYTHQKELFGKKFLIQDTLQQWDWKLGSETKIIGKYTCYQATAILKIDTTLQNLQSLGRNRERRGNRPQADSVQRDSLESGGNANRRGIRNERLVTAWYTPQIPVSQGPGPYWGLPGLILEVNDGRTTILCDKITVNAADKLVLEAPSKGKNVDQAAYDKILLEKMTEIINSQGGDRRPGGNGRRNRG